MKKISAVLVVKNEEKNIEKCLSSIKAIVNEIVVVDDESTDSTKELAKKFTDKIFEYKSVGYVEPARNFALSKATGDWILVLDADEEISPVLGKVLRKIAQENVADFVKIPRKNYIFSKWIQHTGWWPDYQIRFFKTGKVKWDDSIHSVPEAHGKGITLDAVEENAIIHNNYQSVSQFVQKLDSYTSFQSSSLERFAQRALFREPEKEFTSRFFSQRGYKDGIHGFALSKLMSFYQLIVLLKVWEREGFKDEGENILGSAEKEFKNTQKDLAYWLLSAKIVETKNPLKKVLYKLIRRIV